MSETVLKIIPIDQDYVPSPAQQANALARLRELVPFGMHEARVYDDLTFIDQANIARRSYARPALVVSRWTPSAAAILLGIGITV
jgi:hypothetical protein